jgi:hypothetical protein
LKVYNPISFLFSQEAKNERKTKSSSSSSWIFGRPFHTHTHTDTHTKVRNGEKSRTKRVWELVVVAVVRDCTQRPRHERCVTRWLRHARHGTAVTQAKKQANNNYDNNNIYKKEKNRPPTPQNKNGRAMDEVKFIGRLDNFIRQLKNEESHLCNGQRTFHHHYQH